MSRGRSLGLIFAALLTGSVVAALRAPEPPQAAMAHAAQAFLKTLRPEQRMQATFPFNGEERLNWQFIPTAAQGRPGVVRKGLPLKAMTPLQRNAALTLLKVGLSQSNTLWL